MDFLLDFGDFHFFYVNATPFMWIVWILFIAGFSFLYFKVCKTSKNALIMAALFSISTFILVSYISVNIFIGLFPISLVLIITMAIAVRAQDWIDKKNNTGPYSDEAIKKKEIEELMSRVEQNSGVCPNCSSKDIQFMQNNKKSFSVGKAAAGAALTGGIGTLAGFAGKKGKNQWFCKTCGSIFETK